VKTFTRIILGYVLVLAVSGYFVVYSALDTLKPGMRQSAEETLVDTANLLASLVSAELINGTLNSGDFAQRMAEYSALRFNADIWGVTKYQPNHRIYVTDHEGQVVFDSAGLALGADYSRWNDVYRTLRGEYGARTTAERPGDPGSTVMYVAAPVMDGADIIGVLTVGKANQSMQPFVEKAEQKIWLGGAIALLGALCAALAIAWWNTRSVRLLQRYADEVSNGKRVQLPPVSEPELATLGTALEAMRERLDGKSYFGQYVQSLTHELKSPLWSIISAGELLDGEVDAADRRKLVSNVLGEAQRIQQIIERLLNLAQIEQRQGLDQQQPCALNAMLSELLTSRAVAITACALNVDTQIATNAVFNGDPFLLKHALDNLLDNALHFSPSGGLLNLTVFRSHDQWTAPWLNSAQATP